jgi:hypothetical protein
MSKSATPSGGSSRQIYNHIQSGHILTDDLYRSAQFLWIGEWLSPIERLCLTSFRDWGWRTILYIFQPIANIPDGIEVRAAHEIIAEDQIFEDKFGEFPGRSFTAFADLFRLELLARRGGWWFDMDMVAVRGPERYRSLCETYVASTWEMHWRQHAINCAMYAPPFHPLMIAMRDEATALIKKRDFEFADTGPHLLERTLRERSMADCIAPFWEFCPYPWRQIRMTCSGSNRELLINLARLIKHLVRERIDPNFKSGRVRAGTTAVHLHNEIWRRAGISKSGPFHPLSFVGRALRRHGIEVP